MARRNRRLCQLATEGHPEYLGLILGDERPVAAPPSALAHASPPTIPLAGDLVAQLTRRIGADRAARWVASKVGAECHCESRRQALNRLDAKLRTWLGV